MRSSIGSKLLLAALLFLWAASAFAQIIPGPGIAVQDEGTPLGRAGTANCVGAGITCTVSGNIWTLNVSGGGASGAGVNTLNTLSGDLFILGTASQILVNTSSPNITLSTPQDIAAASTVTFASATLTQLGGVGNRCVHANPNGTLSVTASDCGSAASGVSSLNSLTGALTLANGTAINITSNGLDTLTVNNTGVAFLTPAGALRVSQNVGSVTLSNAGIEFLATSGNGISVNQNVGSVTITNTGVHFLTAGSGISVDQHVGSVTITNTGSLVTTFIAAGTGITVDRNIGSVTVTNAGVTSITGTASQVIANASTGAVTLSTPQNISSSSDVTFHGATLTSLGGGGTLCVHVDNTGVLGTAAGDCGTGGSGITSLNTLTGPALFIASGTTGPGITISSPSSTNIKVDIANETWGVVTSSVTVTNSATFTDVNGILCTCGTSSTEMWFFEMFLMGTNPSTNPDYKFQWTVPSGVTMNWGGYTGAAAQGVWGHIIAAGTPTVPLGVGAVITEEGRAGQTLSHFNGLINCGGTAGAVQLQFAQNTATIGATSAIDVGSTIICRKVVP